MKKTLWKPTDLLSVGFLFIFLLLGTATAGVSQDSPGWPDALSDVSHQLHHPEDDSPISSSRSDSLARISSHREKVLMDRANLSARVQNLSEAHSQKNGVNKADLTNSSVEDCINCSSPDGNSTGRELDHRSYFENYMDVSVSEISVRAVNTVDGGSATAISNIIIEPVQIIDLTSEVREKLR